MKFNESLLFPLADAMQLPLYLMGTRFRAHKEQSVKAGPWTLKTEVTAISDELGQYRASMFCRIRKSLWAYFICDHQGNRLRCTLFNAERLHVKSKDIESLCTGDAIKTLVKIAPATVGNFVFHEEKWRETDEVVNLVQGTES